MSGAVDLGIADQGERAGREQAAQIAIALFADTTEFVLAPARVLLRHQPGPMQVLYLRSIASPESMVSAPSSVVGPRGREPLGADLLAAGQRRTLAAQPRASGLLH